jgi:hypothetical protein
LNPPLPPNYGDVENWQKGLDSFTVFSELGENQNISVKMWILSFNHHSTMSRQGKEEGVTISSI